MENPVVFAEMSPQRLDAILGKMDPARIGLIGDVCLDVYWHADMRKSELSRETPHFPLPIVHERMSPGAGGNVVANLAALQPATLKVISVIGQDWRGTELIRLFSGLGLDTSDILAVPHQTTNAYIKPLRAGISDLVYEDPRLDFANYTPIGEAVENELIDKLNRAAACLDVLCVSDQMRSGVITGRIRDQICKLADEGLRVLVDSRDHIGLFHGVMLKPNEVEGARAVGARAVGAYPASLHGMIDLAATARQLAQQNSGPVFMTIGALGALHTDSGRVTHIPAPAVEGPIDICGAGDSFLAGLALALAAGADACEAALIGNLCSSVTIRQIGTTGTATREQIRMAAQGHMAG